MVEWVCNARNWATLPFAPTWKKSPSKNKRVLRAGSRSGGAAPFPGPNAIWGLRNPADPKHAALPKERVKAPAEAVKEAEVMVIATPWSAAEAAISKRRIGEDKLGVEVFLLWLIGLPFQRASLSDPVHCSKVVS
jgi:hypothetical protein